MKRIIVFLGLVPFFLLSTAQTASKDMDVFVISHLNEKYPFGTNILYAPTFRASWTLLKEIIIGEDIILSKPLSIAAQLNKSPYKVPDNNDWLAMAGFVENGIFDKINSAMKQKFGIEKTGLKRYTKDEGIICYSYFRKSLSFSKPFENFNWDFLEEDGLKTVQCFGVSKGKEEYKRLLREQVKIYDYRNPDEFIIILSGSDMNKEIVLAKTPFDICLQAMITDIDDRISYPDIWDLSDSDELIIPKINLDLQHSYNELLDIFLVNKGFEEYFFARAAQKISFTLDESGAKAEASGEIILKKGPKSMIYAFDKPFLVIFRDKGSDEPDIVLWIDNSQFLKPPCQK